MQALDPLARPAHAPRGAGTGVPGRDTWRSRSRGVSGHGRRRARRRRRPPRRAGRRPRPRACSPRRGPRRRPARTSVGMGRPSSSKRCVLDDRRRPVTAPHDHGEAPRRRAPQETGHRLPIGLAERARRGGSVPELQGPAPPVPSSCGARAGRDGGGRATGPCAAPRAPGPTWRRAWRRGGSRPPRSRAWDRADPGTTGGPLSGTWPDARQRRARRARGRQDVVDPLALGHEPVVVPGQIVDGGGVGQVRDLAGEGLVLRLDRGELVRGARQRGALRAAALRSGSS